MRGANWWRAAEVITNVARQDGTQVRELREAYAEVRRAAPPRELT